MLNRIISIKNVGRFKSCSAVGDVTFRRFTLIFAENGRGKTTLCAILRSLFTNSPAYIIGRKTLGNPERPEIQLLTDAGTIVFRNGVWNAAFPDIAVYDGTYVSENVFAGDVVDTGHRRNLYRVIIGAQGVTLASHLNDLDDLIRDKTTDIRNNRTSLERYLPPGMTVENFIALPEDAQIDAKIAAKEQELQAVQRASQLQQRAGLAAIPLPVFPTAFAEVLAKTFANVSADAERRVGEHIALHQMQARGETWISEGLRYVASEECPFCGQGLAAGVDLLQAYKVFFSREYHALRDEVTGLSTQVEAAIGERVSAAIKQTFLKNDNSAEFWQQYCAIAQPALAEADSAGEVMRALRESAQSLLQIKAGTPLDRVAPGDVFTRALGAFEGLRTSLGSYNAAVAAVNAVITARKQQTQAANIQDVENALAKLNAQKARHTDGARGLCASYTRLLGLKAALEEGKGRARQELDAHTQQVIAQYGQSINRYLERINGGFRITTPTHTYRGGSPSTSYQIVINQNAVDLGDAATPLDRPSFRNTLSSGDRSTLALAFFLAQVAQDGDRAKKVIVFDDPFTSQDGFRRNSTVHQIYKCGETCAQVILLSHEPSFLKLLWDRVPPADRKTLQLARVGEENTTIAEWDIEKAVQARYKADIDTLQRFFSDSEGERMDVIQKIRPVLEGYCRNLYPTQFGDQDMMGTIIGKIRTTGAAHPLFPIVEDLDELNMYCRRYHHSENPSAAVEPIDDAELQGYVKKTLKLVGGLL
jgi:wobble nucleotide-excising tRNase